MWKNVRGPNPTLQALRSKIKEVKHWLEIPVL